MSKKDPEKPTEQGISKLKLAIGAASLFLFIIGVKRTFQMDQAEKAPEKAPRQNRGSRKP
jgi:hypothetical protein